MIEIARFALAVEAAQKHLRTPIGFIGNRAAFAPIPHSRFDLFSRHASLAAKMNVPKTHCRGGVLRHTFKQIARDKWACTECDEPYTGQKDAIFIQSIQCPKCDAVWDDGRFNACGCYTREVTRIATMAARKITPD